METIIAEFEKFMGQHGQYYHEFYVGIAADPVDRLTNGHGINEAIPHVYWTQALRTDIVRTIEKYFLGKGVKGGPGGGDDNTCYIYTYKITPQTIE